MVLALRPVKTYVVYLQPIAHSSFVNPCMKKTILFLVLCAFAIGCKSDSTKVITVKGSDTMVQLAQRWSEEYMKGKRNVQLQVTGGGSGTGISALINGMTDICASSRPMKDSERQKLAEKYKSEGVEVKVARDGLTI